MSFRENGVSANSYASNNTNKPAPYVDPLNAANNQGAPSEITVS